MLFCDVRLPSDKERGKDHAEPLTRALLSVGGLVGCQARTYFVSVPVASLKSLACLYSRFLGPGSRQKRPTHWPRTENRPNLTFSPQEARKTETAAPRATLRTLSTFSSRSKTTSLVRRDKSLAPSLSLLRRNEKDDPVPLVSASSLLPPLLPLPRLLRLPLRPPAWPREARQHGNEHRNC